MFCGGIPDIFCGGIPDIVCGGIPDAGGAPEPVAGSAVLDEVTADKLAVELIMPFAELCGTPDDPILEAGAGDNAFGG